MFGCFTEEALSKYASMAERKAKGEQSSEWMDNAGIGTHDHRFLDEEKRRGTTQEKC
jgi:hypothetical protein